jgi:hypothetical protein
MTFQPLKKATLLMPSGPPGDPERLHLWVILTDPCDLEANIIVSLSTLHRDRFHDPSCIVEAGEHRRVTARSWANYRLARAVPTRNLVKGEAAWYYRMDAPVSDTLYEKLCKGLLESEHTTIRLRRYFEGKASAF